MSRSLPESEEVAARRRIPSDDDRSRFRMMIAGMAAAVALCVVCFWALLRSGVDYQTRALDGWSIDDPNFLGLGTRVRGVEMPSSILDDGHRRHEIEITELNVLPWATVRSVSLMFDIRTPMESGEYDRLRGRVWSATLETGGGTNEILRLISTRETTLSSEGRLEFFTPQVDCACLTNHARAWRLRVDTDVGIRLYLRSNVSAPGHLKEAWPRGGSFSIALTNSPGGPSFAYPMGDFTLNTKVKSASRGRLLGYLWQWRDLSTVFAWTFGACAIFGFGAALFPWLAGPNFNGWRFGLKAGVSCSLMFFGLGSLQTLFTPPFFGTDEPTHVFSYHMWMNDLDAVERTFVLGERNHAIRMLWRPAQKFATADLDQPMDRFVDSPTTMYTRPGGRSAIAARFWGAFRDVIAGERAATMILRLRLLSLAAATICLFLGVTALAATSTPETPSAWLCWGLLLIPSLPYYAMNVSNYPWVLGAAFLVAAGINALVNQTETPWWVGFLIGLGTSLTFFTSVSGWPVGVVVAFALLAIPLRRFITVQVGPVRVAWRFWGSVAIGLCSLAAFSTQQYWSEHHVYIGLALRRFGISHLPSFVSSYVALVWAACVLLAGLEWICAWLASESTAAVGVVVAKTSIVLTCAVIGLMATNLFLPMQSLDSLTEAVPHWEFHLGQARAALPADASFERPPLPSPSQYSKQALRAVVTSLGFGNHDYLTEKLFWLAIGSIETSAPEWILSTLSTLVGLGLAFLFWRIAATGNGPRLVQVLFTLAGLIACLALTAIGSVTSPATPSLHGRYLMGFHIILVLLASIGFKTPVLYLLWRAPMVFASVCLAAVVIVHASCFWIELGRYF